MLHRLIVALACLLLAGSAQAQDGDAHRHDAVRTAAQAVKTQASPGFDATFYSLDLTLDPEAEHLDGTVQAEGWATQPLDTLVLDLANEGLHVAAVRGAQGDKLAFRHEDDRLAIALPRTFEAGERVAVEIDYGGRPDPQGHRSFVFDRVGGEPVVWTLSEPYGARAWWPSKDHPSDKADSVRIAVTVPEGLTVGSNGLLVERRIEGGQATFVWEVMYPITTYLVSLAVGPYARFEQTYVRPDSLAARFGPLTMPVEHYVYEADGTAALPAGWAEVVDALAVFESWFGPYPFAREKYGHAQFTAGGGMEHQTLSSMGSGSVALVTHELAHQWYGDAVTNAFWPHLWLHEGFATYAELLYWEAFPERHPGAFETALRTDMSRALRAEGTLVVQDTLDVDGLFAGERVYGKGAAVLHMLRQLVGDAAFREALQAYVRDPALRYGTATTEDFQHHAEAASGRDLDRFFYQWVTDGYGHPTFDVRYSFLEQGPGLEVTVAQTQTEPLSNVEVFETPITLSITTGVGEERFEVVQHQRVQTFTLETAAEPLRLAFDPDDDLLHGDVSLLAAETPPWAEAALLLEAYPNPASGTATVRYYARDPQPLRLSVFDALGRLVHRRELPPASGLPREERLGLEALPAGVYVLRLASETHAATERLTVL